MGLLTILSMNDAITVNEAAEILGVQPDRVRKLCQHHIINCEKFGPVWMVSRASVEAYKSSYRKPGPKPKDKPDKNPDTNL